jgi:hypothetical protein
MVQEKGCFLVENIDAEKAGQITDVVSKRGFLHGNMSDKRLSCKFLVGRLASRKIDVYRKLYGFRMWDFIAKMIVDWERDYAAVQSSDVVKRVKSESLMRDFCEGNVVARKSFWVYEEDYDVLNTLASLCAIPVSKFFLWFVDDWLSRYGREFGD